MAAGSRVSTDCFVLRSTSGASLERVRKAAEPLGTIQAVPSRPGVFLLQLSKPVSPDPKEVWQFVQQSLGDDFEVDPVFVDDSGARRFSLGTIQARFQQTPSDGELSSWSEQRGLQVQARNRYVPNQIAFRLATPQRQFLPEVLNQVQSEVDRPVEVWPETLSEFTREA